MSAGQAGRGPVGRLGSAAIAGLTLLAFAPAAAADTVHVRDDRPNAIQQGVNRASDGDRVAIHRGRYRGDVVVNKRVRLVGVSRRRPVVNGACISLDTIAVRHNRVVLRHLKVIGGAPGGDEVDFRFLTNGRAEDLRVKDTCGGAGGAEYGINLYFAPGVDVIANKVGPGFTDAGIYVGDIHRQPVVGVRRNESFRNNVGIIVEFSESPAEIRTVNNRVHDNRIAGNYPPTGIFVFGADDMFFKENRIWDSGVYGIRLLGPPPTSYRSDNNVFIDNRFANNPDPLRDDGIGNCGFGNRPSSGPNSFPPC